ncbi:MAG: LPXTG cell wall anchor domain-containing protein, partial [Culicoidibacterales bacterium]
DFGPDGDVTPEVTPEVDAGASEGFGPDGDVTPTVTPTIPTTGTPESNSTTTLPETGEQLQASLLVFGAMLIVGGSVLAYRKKQTHN